MRTTILIAGLAAALLPLGPVIGQAKRPLPYWASLSAGDALLRTGPGRDYPATWRYRRTGLPLKVIAIHESWRRVREVDGTEGWMAAVLLTEARTGLVTGGVHELRTAPDAAAPIAWRVAQGVIGKLSECDAGWCELDVHGRKGFIRADAIWGVDPGETVR